MIHDPQPDKHGLCTRCHRLVNTPIHPRDTWIADPEPAKSENKTHPAHPHLFPDEGRW